MPGEVIGQRESLCKNDAICINAPGDGFFPDIRFSRWDVRHQPENRPVYTVQHLHPCIKYHRCYLVIIVKTAKYERVWRQPALRAIRNALADNLARIICLVAPWEVNDFLVVELSVIWRDYALVRNDIINIISS